MQFKLLNEVKKLEGLPKVVSLFTKNETDELIQLYKDLPTTIYNKKQNVIKKRWLQNYNEKLDKLYLKKLKEVLGDFAMDNLKAGCLEPDSRHCRAAGRRLIYIF